MARRYFQWICLLSVLTASSSSLLFAQNESGSITGEVTDPSGAVVAGAVVTITDLGTTTSRTATTGSNGSYSFSTLRPSHYKIAVTAANFKESLIADIELHTQDKLSENVTLTLGSSSESVNVSAETEQIE